LLAQELLHEVGRELLLQSHSNCAQGWVACGRQLWLRDKRSPSRGCASAGARARA
jgi:hypothetical protein